MTSYITWRCLNTNVGLCMFLLHSPLVPFHLKALNFTSLFFIPVERPRISDYPKDSINVQIHIYTYNIFSPLFTPSCKKRLVLSLPAKTDALSHHPFGREGKQEAEVTPGWGCSLSLICTLVCFNQLCVSVRCFRTIMHLCLHFVCLFLANSAFHICSSAEHGNKTGTNLHSALYRVYELISLFKQNRATNHFNDTQNIIIIETDGERKTIRALVLQHEEGTKLSLSSRVSYCRLLQHRPKPCGCPETDPGCSGLQQCN